MGLKSAMQKIKRTLLCCRKEDRKRSLKIGPSTDVRRMDITEGMPNLTEEDAKFIQEKASNDAYRLLSLQSHPPTQPSTPPVPSTNPFTSASAFHTDPFASTFASAAASQTHLPTPSPSSTRSRSHSREPSLPLLATASTSQLSTTQKRKNMWDRTRRLSSSLSHRSSPRSSAGYQGLSANPTQSHAQNQNTHDEGVAMLDLDVDGKEDTRSGVSVKVPGFEVQETVGGRGTLEKKEKEQRHVHPLIERAVNATEVGDSSDSEAEVERRPLVKT